MASTLAAGDDFDGCGGNDQQQRDSDDESFHDENLSSGGYDGDNNDNDHHDDDDEEEVYSIDPQDSSEVMNESSSAADGSACFFADATLDVEEAHKMADTPVLSSKPPVTSVVSLQQRVAMPPPPLDISGSLSNNNNQDSTNPLNTKLDGISNTEMTSNLNSKVPAPTQQTLTAPPTATPNLPILPMKDDGKSMNRISNTDFQRSTPSSTSRNGGGFLTGGPTTSNPHHETTLPSNSPTYRPRPPRRPRDLLWAISFVLFVPLSLFAPFYLSNRFPHSFSKHNDGEEDIWSTRKAHTTTLFSILFAYGTTVLLARLLYRTLGGGDGDDARHFASGVIVNSNPVAFAVHPILVLLIYWKTPNGFVWALIPMFFFVRDIFMFRERLMSPPTSASGSGGGGGGVDRTRDGGGSGRRTFFRALTSMALDILSRSLRRSSFHRVVSLTLLAQLVVVVLWRTALFTALSVSHNPGGKLLVLTTFLGGKWATGTVSRVLGLIASGGVTAWFAQQSILIEEMGRMKANARQNEQQQQQASASSAAAAASGAKGTASSTGGEGGGGGGGSSRGDEDTASDDYSVGYGDGAMRTKAALLQHQSSLSDDAYRTADASAYSPVIDFDEGMDDDLYDDDDDSEYYGGEYDDGGGMEGTFVGNGGRGMGTRPGFRRGSRNTGGGGTEWTGGGTGYGGSTVKSFLLSAVTVSFGSVAQCGALGGTAQLVWSAVRNADQISAALTRRFSSSRFGFRGMDIGNGTDGGTDGDGGGGGRARRRRQMARRMMMELARRTDVSARAFVRGHSDLAMSHVAAYFKSYQRAANDVATLIDSSGVEPIVHDDITSHMCASVSTAASGCIVIFIGYILSNHRGQNPHPLSDNAVCEIMFLSFILCYTVLATVMEPLRASIKAVYVCFAQHPQSLSQAFPLIFHRLSRISEANLV